MARLSAGFDLNRGYLAVIGNFAGVVAIAVAVAQGDRVVAGAATGILLTLDLALCTLGSPPASGGRPYALLPHHALAHPT